MCYGRTPLYFLVSSRSTVSSSSTVRRSWTSTYTVWSLPCRPTLSTSSTAVRFRSSCNCSSEPRAPPCSTGWPEGGAAATNKTWMTTTMVSDVCTARRQIQRVTSSVCSPQSKKASPRVLRCTLLLTSPMSLSTSEQQITAGSVELVCPDDHEVLILVLFLSTFHSSVMVPYKKLFLMFAVTHLGAQVPPQSHKAL